MMYASDNAISQDLGKSEERIKTVLRAVLGDEVFSVGFNQLRLEAMSENVAKFSVATSFFRSWVERNYRETLLSACPSGTERIELALRAHATVQKTPPKPQPRLESPTVEDPVDAVAPPKAELVCRSAHGKIEGSPINSRNIFETIIVTASNRMAYAAALQLAELAPEETPQFTLHVCGSESGSGRSHLLQALALATRASKQKVLYMTGERFVAAHHSFEPKCNFVAAFDGLDILIVDDVEPIMRSETVAAFLAILRRMHDRDARIATSARKEPIDLPCYNKAIGAVGSPLVAHIRPLDEAQRRAVATRLLGEKTANSPAFIVEENAVAYISQQLAGGHQIEQAIVQCFLWWQMHRKPVTLEVAGGIVSSVTAPVTRLLKIDDIVKFVARRFGISRTEILSDRRTRIVVWPRQVGMYLAKTLTTRSLPEIGRRFGNRDHTTVLHAIRKVENKIEESPAIAQEIEDLKQGLQQSA